MSDSKHDQALNMAVNQGRYSLAKEVIELTAERDQLRSALRVISVWAMNDALDNDHVGRLCDKALGCNDGEHQ